MLNNLDPQLVKTVIFNIIKIYILIASLQWLYGIYYDNIQDEYEISKPGPGLILFGPQNMKKRKVFDTYNQLCNIKNFTFKKNPQPCKGYEAGLLLLVIVSSTPKSFEKRSVIRTTWGEHTDSTKVLFLIGETDNEKVAKKLEMEIATHGDIVLGSFSDTRRSLTYKHLMGLKWVVHHCPMARYVLKTVDDVVVNLFALRRFLVRQMSPWGAAGLMGCFVKKNGIAHRVTEDWYVSYGEYRYEIYPEYCLGDIIIYSQDVLQRLLEAAPRLPYFWVDDVQITGIIAEKLEISRINMFFLLTFKDWNYYMKSRGSEYLRQFKFVTVYLSPAQMMVVWSKIKQWQNGVGKTKINKIMSKYFSM